MTVGKEDIEFEFLDEEKDVTAGDFLKRRLTFMLTHFSYEQLSGLSIDGLNKKIEYYNLLLDQMSRQFTNPESVWADPAFAACVTDGEYDLYEPLTENQQMEILRVADQISGNFDKAREDAQDRRFERLGTLVSSIPLMGRIQGKA